MLPPQRYYTPNAYKLQEVDNKLINLFWSTGFKICVLIALLKSYDYTTTKSVLLVVDVSILKTYCKNATFSYNMSCLYTTLGIGIFVVFLYL